MSKKVIVNGMNIGYLPPTNASEITFDNSGGGISSNNVQDVIEEINTNKVSKSGDTMRGNLIVDRQDGTVSNLGQSTIVAGNTIPQGTDNNSQGRIFLCAANDKYSTIQTLQNLSTNNIIYVPDKSGTIALREDFNVNITETRFYLTRPQGLALIEASLPFVGRKPSSVSVTNVKYYNGSTWANLTVESTSIMDNCIIVECTVPTGFEQGKVYWGQAQIVATYS